MYFGLALTTHLLAAIIWIGGMFFAYTCLRPSLGETLAPAERARLLTATFSRFFHWVWIAIPILFATGLYMAFTRYGVMGTWPIFLHVMFGVAIIMSLLFFHIFFAPFKRLKRAMAQKDPQQAGAAIGQIRMIVLLNLALGIIVAIAASGGRYI
ncbi:MAG: CopD family protein [Pseudomonadota bacterium]